MTPPSFFVDGTKDICTVPSPEAINPLAAGCIYICTIAHPLPRGMHIYMHDLPSLSVRALVFANYLTVGFVLTYSMNNTCPFRFRHTSAGTATVAQALTRTAATPTT